MAINKHEIVEKNVGVLMVMICIAISFATLVEIVPLFFQKDLNEPVPGMKPLTALQLEGRDIYIREGCHVCHTQMIRPLRAETERYGHYSVAGESVWDHPFLWGSKRTGPDLARIGEKYSDDWHQVHLINPRDVVPESNMPGFPWLLENKLDGELTAKKMEIFRNFGVPYTDADIQGGAASVKGKTEMEALIAYMQQLGTVMKQRR
ncbi:cytochrome-c oxidase, cbb3-type subunit II [Moraxellaceae bacterium AER2_44_116]|jgi:cytochrome c oxidase cbb3-type subunit 2|nr:cytochrome-c oxidase, cbb3-type subunit II [Moraxellaceae bacterium AER2_44_116]